MLESHAVSPSNCIAQYRKFVSLKVKIVDPSLAGVTVTVLLLSEAAIVSAFTISVAPALLQFMSLVSALAPFNAVMSLDALPANILNLPSQLFKL